MGIISRAQLLSSGVGRGTITRRVAAGSLRRVLPSVYSTHEPTYSDLCRAVTVWKPDAVLSHDTAAHLWGLLPTEPSTVHATLPLTASASAPTWVRLHRRSLRGHTWIGAMPVVSPEQSILDASATLPRDALERMIDTALSRTISWRALARLCDESAGMVGAATLREQLRRCCPETRSEAERRVARALTARNMHLEINAQVGPYYGDLVDYRARVVVEIDGREFHTGPAEFTRDRVRQNHLVLDGWLVLRYSAATTFAHLDATADEIVRVVRRRRALARASASRMRAQSARSQFSAEF